ncbi:Uncharacterised protein [Bartonella vinsonii]|uniref:Uncharacterized protein n=1 Tax=Bartonella vinsonii TaxID=33047 RepID=A0A448V6J9_BARVI|nr:Uncharacterised protein [Bartonella vinsonii]
MTNVLSIVQYVIEYIGYHQRFLFQNEKVKSNKACPPLSSFKIARLVIKNKP